MDLDRDDLRAYARRDWAAPERLARRQRATQSIEAKVALAIELFEAARAAVPGWPDAAARARDLQGHVSLRKRLKRAAHVGVR